MPNSARGGNFFSFDGFADSVYAAAAWLNDSNTFSGNISVRWLDLPSMSDNYAGILVSQPWKLYLKNNGFGKGTLSFIVENSSGTGVTELDSSVDLNSNTWYDISFEVYNNALTLAVDGDIASTSLIGGMLNSSSSVLAGQAESAHYYKGDMDEVRFGAVIPEPCLFIIYYLSFIIYYRGKF
jgi:hypothetical protein